MCCKTMAFRKTMCCALSQIISPIWWVWSNNSISDHHKGQVLQKKVHVTSWLRTFCPVSELSESALCCGSLVLQDSKTLCLNKQPYAARIKNLMSLYYGPTFTVLVMLRIASASASSTAEEQLLVDQGMRNTAKTKNAAWESLEAELRGKFI